MSLNIESPAFARNAPIPDQFARQGANVSPRLEWRGAPLDTRSFALIVEDPDAPSGTCRHWAIYNIDAGANHLPEGVSAGEFAQAGNYAGRARYDGPKPPKGHGPHHYHFRLAALDVPSLEVRNDANALELWRAAEPHVLAEAEFVGTYETA